ncbi:hypothetical protein QVD17_08013 [Tagetes erecta]|uniref:Uncharacterized protein n=1 Tax=Tagetes erecta TaxID=13708 RepID=A0AAD8P306_TARER|nr:hypothetical protein QVD17_08013 [Tagetes erecta]
MWPRTGTPPHPLSGPKFGVHFGVSSTKIYTLKMVGPGMQMEISEGKQDFTRCREDEDMGSGFMKKKGLLVEEEEEFATISKKKKKGWV